MERALLLSGAGEIEPEHLPLGMLSPEPIAPVSIEDISEAPDDPWGREERAERSRIIEALRAEAGNQTRAARRLGVSRGTLLSRIDAYELGRPQKRRRAIQN